MPNFCSVEGCFCRVHAKGMCQKHYRAMNRVSNSRPRCKIKWCDRPIYAKGVCSRHYQRKTQDLIDTSITLPGELWKDVSTHRGLYQVSNLGRVKSLPHIITRTTRGGGEAEYRVNGKILTPHKCAGGYLFVRLYNKTENANAKVHRLVATAFIPNPDNKPEVNHINGDKNNNTVDNLEWCSRKENNWHSKRVLGNGLIPVRCVETGRVYQCMSDADKDMGLSPGSISDVIEGSRKTARGYHWKKMISR